MCPKDGAAVFAVQMFEPAKPAMNIHVVDEKISNTIKGNAHAYEHHPKMRGCGSKNVTKHARNCENKKKTVILFKKTFFFMFGQVVIFMPLPQKTVHHKFVCEPGHEFHADVCGQCNKGIKQPSGHHKK